jgi:hypothetical protein
MLRKLNLDGDKQADLTVHGGVDKAVYSYPAEHYDYWRKQLPDTHMRGLFYILISKNILENLQNRYKGLSRKLVEARKKEEINPDCIVDESRTIIDINDSFYPLEQIIDAQLDILKSLPENYKRRYIPRWYGQPRYVEVWVEKKAMAGVLKSILAGYEV